MRSRRLLVFVFLCFALMFGFSTPWRMQAQDNKTPYPTMAPLDQYLMDRDAEIAMARSAAPESVSKDAKVLVLGRHGYETAVEGKNDFVCLVGRMWAAMKEDPEFWNPKGRAPVCLNAPAVRSYLPVFIKRTELALAGRSKTQIEEAVSAAIEKKELPTIEPNAMSYMLSKQGYINDGVHGPWRPHLMLFLPEIDPGAWGANLQGAPVTGEEDTVDHLTMFYIPVSKWSDGTPAPAPGGH